MPWDWEKSAKYASDRMFELANKPERYTNEDIIELRALLTRGVFRGATDTSTMHFRTSIDTIEAIRELNEATGSLVNTTNVLTTRIFWLTVGAVFLGVVQVVIAVISLFSSK